jgi:hypothetical protein
LYHRSACWHARLREVGWLVTFELQATRTGGRTVVPPDVYNQRRFTLGGGAIDSLRGAGRHRKSV